MKNFLIVILTAAILFLTACNNPEQSSDTDNKADGKTTTSAEIETKTETNIEDLTYTENETKTKVNTEDFTYMENDDGEIIITWYKGKEKDVVFPASIDGKPVVQIGYDNDAVVNEDIQSVFIPDVEKIGGWAFVNCKKLNEITISEGVKEIDSCAFLRCENLTEITIPNSVEVIGSMAFSECGISEITIPGSVKIIRSGAFADCKNLTGLTISEGVEVIDSQAFSECEKLTELTFPDSVKKIGLDAFRNCGIKNVTLPDGLTGFKGGRTFTDCDVVYKGETYSPELYGELYKAINGEYYMPPSGIPPAA